MRKSCDFGLSFGQSFLSLPYFASVVLMMVGGGYGTCLVCRGYWLVNTHQLSDFFLGVFGSCHSKASMQSIQRALNLI